MKPLKLNALQSQMLAAYVQGRYLTGVRAGWGSGKSFGLGLVAALAGEQRPGDAAVWVTDTRARLESIVQPVCTELLGRRYGWKFHGDPSKFYWEHPTNGFRLWLRMYYRASTRTQDQNPLEGLNVSLALVDESQALPPEVLAALVGRVRTGTATISIMCVGLPVWGAWWVEAAERMGAAGCALFATSHVNAENLNPDFFDRARDALSPEMYASRIDNVPFAPIGQVLNNWAVGSWPAGNIVDGWRPNARRQTRAAVDFGRRSPAVVLLESAEIDGEEVDVAFAEVAPDECLVDQLCGHVNVEIDRWGVRVYTGAGDPAGKAINDQTGISSIDRFAHPRSQGGTGISLRYETDPIKRHIPNGIDRLKRRILGHDGVRRLVVTRELWDAGERRPGRTLRRSIEGYRYPDTGGDIPVKDGKTDHHIDALRYDAIVWHWDEVAGLLAGAYTRSQGSDSPVADLLGGR